MLAPKSLASVNNRDLRTFKVSLETSKRLWPLIPDSILAVAESGIKDVTDIRELCSVGFQAVLVGELLVTVAECATARDNASDTEAGYDRVRELIKSLILQ